MTGREINQNLKTKSHRYTENEDHICGLLLLATVAGREIQDHQLPY